MKRPFAATFDDARLNALLYSYPCATDAQDPWANEAREILRMYPPSDIGPETCTDVLFAARLQFFREYTRFIPELFYDCATYAPVLLKNCFLSLYDLADEDVYDPSIVRPLLTESHWQSYVDYILDEPTRNNEVLSYFIPGGNTRYYPLVFGMLYIHALERANAPVYLYASKCDVLFFGGRVSAPYYHMRYPVYHSSGEIAGVQNDAHTYTPLGSIFAENCQSDTDQILSIISAYTCEHHVEPLMLVSRQHYDQETCHKVKKLVSTWLIPDLADIVAQYHTPTCLEVQPFHLAWRQGILDPYEFL